MRSCCEVSDIVMSGRVSSYGANPATAASCTDAKNTVTKRAHDAHFHGHAVLQEPSLVDSVPQKLTLPHEQLLLLSLGGQQPADERQPTIAGLV